MSSSVTLKGGLNVKVRWAKVEDAARIARLELNSSVYENRSVPFNYTHPQFTKLWEQRLSQENEYKTVIATGPTRIYGFITFKSRIEDGYILALYIDPLYMRHGIGTLLMKTAEQMVLMSGGKKLKVDVEMLNNGAMTFYRSLHFSKVSVKLEHLIEMEKEL